MHITCFAAGGEAVRVVETTRPTDDMISVERFSIRVTDDDLAVLQAGGRIEIERFMNRSNRADVIIDTRVLPA